MNNNYKNNKNNKNNNLLFCLNNFKPKLFKKNAYNIKEECEKNNKLKWVQTNPKFKTFDQIYYSAGDFEDFDKFGLLSLLYYLSEKDNNKNKVPPILKIKNNKQDFFKLYKNIDYHSCLNTFNYIFHKFKKGIFVIIQDNQLKLFLPFSNEKYKNNWFKNIYFTNEEKELIIDNKDNDDYNKIRHKLNQYTIEFMKKYPEQFGKHQRKINFQRDKWHANNCVFRNQYPEYEGDQNFNVFKNMLDELVKNREIPDVQFFLNYRDFPILKKDLTEPYDHLFKNDAVKIEKEYQYKKFCPIFSQSITDKFADLLIPTSDDWRMSSSKYFTPKCPSSYNKKSFEQINTDWKTKTKMCVFRGSATGCGMNIENNMRLKAAQLSYENPKILNVGITDFKERPKKYENGPVQIINPDDFRFEKADPLTREEQSNYKYILHIDGYVNAFRLSSELRMRSAILIVESDYKMWYSHLLVPYQHYIPVKKDLSDLIEIIHWCIKNDKKCMEIATNAYQFYEKNLTKDGLFDYMQSKMNTIYMNRNLKNPLVIKKTKKNIALITLYRAQKETNREGQRQTFINYMTRVLPEYCNFHLYIIEQSQDGDKFNIGKLKNIGFEYASKKDKYDAFLFTDIDHLFDYDLLPYCVKKPKYPTCLAYKGTRYSHNIKNNKNKEKFFGGTNIFSSSDFKKLNGYPNNIWGWSTEDRALLLRVHLSGINQIEYPKQGQIIDIETTLDLKPVPIKDKTTYSENRSESSAYEKLLLEPDCWKKNGLNNLQYKVLKTTVVNEYTTQIKVDLLKKMDEKMNPFLYPTSSQLTTNEYKKFKSNTKQKLFNYYDKIKVSLI